MPASPARLWWCNADFDLTLAHGGGKLPAPILAAARDMAWNFWPALPERDTLIVPAPPPESFLRLLAACGLRPPRFATLDQIRSESSPSLRFTPFGWNAAAHRLNAGFAPPTPAPDSAIVKKLNSRAFSAVLEREIFPDLACPATFCASRRDLENWLEGAEPGRYVAKGNHGLAGIGQIRFEISSNFEGLEPRRALLKTLGRLCQRLDGVVVEREQRILAEFGVLFRVATNGSISTICVHHLLSEIDGKFSGALVPPAGNPDSILDPWRKNIDEAVRKIAKVLCEEGYFGPVGVDMYVHESSGQIGLRPVVDLNARCSMAWPVHGLAQCFRGRAVMVRQVVALKIFSSKMFDDMTNVMNKVFFDTESCRGVIPLTPRTTLGRRSLAFVGNDVDDVTDLCKTTLELLALKGKL